MAATATEDRFPSRGSTVLLILMVVVLVGIAVVLLAGGPVGVRIVWFVTLSTSLVFLFLLARALRAGRSWARPVAILELWLVAITGVIDTILALTENRLNIPIGTFLAIYALAAPAGPFRLPAAGAERQKAIVGCIVALATSVGPLLVGVLAARG